MKENRRVRYTKMMIKNSFIELLEVKPISSITIKELCELADINRTTFYSHYNDQYDLLRKIEAELLDNIMEYAKESTFVGEKGTAMVAKIFQYIKDNARVCKLLLSEKGDFRFQKQIMEFAHELIANDPAYLSSFTEGYPEYSYSFVVTGSIGLIQKWLDNDMDKSPEEMANMILKLTNNLLTK